jgi:glucokinase
MSPASSASPGVVVGLDIGGTSTNATVLDGFGRFLVDALCETPSRVLDGPPASLDALGSRSARSSPSASTPPARPARTA